MIGQYAHRKAVSACAWATDSPGEGVHIIFDTPFVNQFGGIPSPKPAAGIQWAAVELDLHVFRLDLAEVNLHAYRHLFVKQQRLIRLRVNRPYSHFGPLALY